MRPRLLASALALLVAAGAVRTPAHAAEGGAYLLGGGHAARVWDQSETARGLSVTTLFRPGSVAQFSQRLADARLGLTLGYNRSRLEGLAKVEGMEITVRRYVGPSERPLRPFVAAGLGQNNVELDAGGARSIWSAVLGGGLERELGGRFLIQLDLLTRTVEFSTDSYTLTALTLSFGARIDA